MLLEEALAAGGNNNANDNTATSPSASSPTNAAPLPPPLLSPHEEALATLSFIRDELPAGGAPAEKRFVNLVPLIVNRLFGEWNDNAVNSRGGRTSPGSGGRGGRSPSSPSVTSPSGSNSSSPIPAVGSGHRDYCHAEGGWLSLTSSPSSRRNSGSDGNHSSRSGFKNPIASSSTYSSRKPSSSSLENDPIVRLLRAPPRKSSAFDGGNASNGNDNYFHAPPTLIEALSAESALRPSVRFKLPLAALSIGGILQPLMDDWTACYWNEFERGARESGVNVVGGASVNTPSRLGLVAATTGGAMQGGSSTDHGTAEKTLSQLGIVGKENATIILLRLLSVRPKDQFELGSHFQRAYHQHQQPSQQQMTGALGSSACPSDMSPLKSLSLLNQNINKPSYRTPPKGGNSSNDEGNLELNMLEYYLFLFVRFPLANKFWTVQMQDYQRTQRYHGGKKISSPYGQRVYSHLFLDYLNYYLRQGKVDEGNRIATSSETTAVMDRTSELFLRLIIEFWIEGPNIVPSSRDAISRYRSIRSVCASSFASAQATNIHPSLSDSLELAQPLQQRPFKSPPSQVQNCVLNLVRLLVSDMTMRELVQSVSGCIQQRQREDRDGGDSGANMPSPLVIDNNDRSSAKGGNSATPLTINGNQVVNWCLSPAMTATQPSIFNYIRLGLACGPIHERSSMFYRALETWLAWLEPWNYIMKRRAVSMSRSGSSGMEAGGGNHRGVAGDFLRNAAATVSSHTRSVEYHPTYVRPKPNSPSAYTTQWEAYIASNVHFYTVPLAIFLKRARELDFSSTVDYSRSLALVQRVFRIYSKTVVNVLNSVLNERADVLTTSLFAQHGTNMGESCPPNNWKLVELQLDATNLLEEVFSQHQKRRAGMDIFDRIEAKLNALFDGKIGSEEDALVALLSQVRYMVNLPLDYEVLPKDPQTTHQSGMWRMLGLGQKDASPTDASLENMFGPERGADGILTDLGRQQIYSGLYKCNPMDVHFIGDPMLARVKSYEIPALVELTIWVSNFLNRKLGLVSMADEDGDDGGVDDKLLKHYREMQQYEKILFRVNLRFLADYRNIILAAIIWWLVSTISGFFRN